MLDKLFWLRLSVQEARVGTCLFVLEFRSVGAAMRTRSDLRPHVATFNPQTDFHTLRNVEKFWMTTWVAEASSQNKETA